MKKLYIVKHEVFAKNIKEAAKIGVGTIFSVVEAEESLQPSAEKPVKGFLADK